MSASERRRIDALAQLWGTTDTAGMAAAIGASVQTTYNLITRARKSGDQRFAPRAKGAGNGGRLRAPAPIQVAPVPVGPSVSAEAFAELVNRVAALEHRLAASAPMTVEGRLNRVEVATQCLPGIQERVAQLTRDRFQAAVQPQLVGGRSYSLNQAAFDWLQANGYSVETRERHPFLDGQRITVGEMVAFAQRMGFVPGDDGKGKRHATAG